jgi:xylitol oxidase
MATAVAEIEIVTAQGDLVRIDRDSPEFSGSVVALGALGIAVSISLDIERAYYVCQHVYDDLPLAALKDHFAEVFAGGSSVSLFTTWRSQRINQMWVKERVAEPGLPPPPRERFGARLADGPRHPVPGYSPAHCTQQLGIPGPWHQRLPHFRQDFTPGAGRELQSELLLPRALAVPAIQALDQISDEMEPVLQVSEIRTVAADDLWLSPSYGRDTVSIHFTWIDDVRTVMPVIEKVQDRLKPFEPRPHWGKLFTVPGHYERLPDFRELARRYDPGGKFRNDFLERYVLGLAG